MQLERFALDQLGLERLDAQSVQCWCTVEQHWVPLHYILKDVPNHWLFRIHNFLGALYGLHHTPFDHLSDDEGLVKFRGHVFRHAAFVELQIWAHDDHRTCRIVYTLSEQVLTETTLLAFQAVTQGFERTVAFRFHSTRLAAVVEETVHSLLQHALLVAQNHLRCLDFHQTLQTVVPDDDTAVQVVQVRRRKTSTIKRHQWTQFRRDHWNHLDHHPLRIVFNAAVGIAQRLHHLQTLELFALALLRSLRVGFVTK